MLRTIQSSLQRIDLRLLIFAVLCLNYLSLVPDENEEEYFAFARYFMDPEWIPGAASVVDVPGTRILFETVVGFGLRYLSFEQMAVLGRCIGAALLSLPLALIFTRLRLSHLQAALFVQICALFPHQSLFGKEWIFGPFETKTIAYALVLYSFYLMLESRHRQSVIFAGLAVWFHILVGGWYTVVLFIYLLLSRVPWRRLIYYGLLVILISLPFLVYLGYSYLLDNPGVIDGIHISWVYVFFRNAHHLAPFDAAGQISGSFLRGIVISLALFIISLRTAIRSSGSDLGRLALFFVATFLQQSLFLVLAYFDTQGEILKYYPFRSSALSFIVALLMALIYAGDITREASASARRHFDRAAAVLVVIALLGLGLNLFKNLHASYAQWYPSPAEADRRLLYGWIAEHTPREARFLNLNPRKREDLDFVRRTARDRFSVYKFVPTSNRLIYQWYLRVQEKERVLSDFARITDLRRRYRVDYVVGRAPVTHPQLTLVYANGHYWLYAFLAD